MLRHTLTSVAAAKNVALSEHGEEACKALGIDDKLYKMIRDNLDDDGALAIDEGIVGAVLDQRCSVETRSFDSSSLYM